MPREFKRYVSTTKFTVSLDESTSETIYQGDEVEFNGQIAIIAGEKFKMPKLRAAIKATPPWLVEKSEAGNHASYRPSSAEIPLSGATPQQEDTVSDGTTEISDEERVVSTVNQRDTFLNEGNRKSQDQINATRASKTSTNTAVAVRGDGQGPQDRSPRHPTIIGDQQDGKDIGVRFKTSADSKTDISKMNDQSFRQTVNDLEKPTMTVQEAQEARESQPEANPNRRVAEGIAFDNHNVGQRSAAGTEPGDSPERAISSNPYDGDHQVVGAVGQKPRPVPTKGRNDRRPVEDVYEEVVEEEELSEDELDDQLDPSVKEARYRIAKIIHPELPEWDFEAHWTKKIQRIKDEFSEDTIVLRALYASESEAIKKRIKKEFGLGL